MWYPNYIKPVVDVVVAIFLLLLLAPFFLILLMLLWILQGKPLFFRQRRAGKEGRPFDVMKLRSMKHSTITGEMVVTPIGRFLRCYSLDEWPQLINVLTGEMSLVGPRPLLVSYTDRFNSNQKKRLDVKPGITGLTQVSGGNLLSWKEKFSLDSKYAEQQSFYLDMKILFKTPAAIVCRKDKGNPVTNF